MHRSSVALATLAVTALACGGPLEDGSEGDEEVTGSVRAPDTAKLVFVTSQTFTGDLRGLRGANQKCNRAAKAARLPGRYAAWLSDSQGGPVAHFTHSSVPYQLVDGTVIANDWTDLTDGTLSSPIDLTEFGEAPPATSFACSGGSTAVFTSTNHLGYPAGFEPERFCGDWTSTSNSVEARFGSTVETGQGWSMACGNNLCAQAFPLYCFQQ